MQSLRHPCIVQFIGSYEEDNKLFVGAKSVLLRSDVLKVMEYVSNRTQNSSLRSLLKDHSIKLSWRQRIKFALDASKAMAYLHSKNVIHR